MEKNKSFRVSLKGYNPAKLEAWIVEGHSDDAGWDHRLAEYTKHIEYNELTTRMPPSQYNKILVIGCANGAELAAVSNQGYEATGITLCCQEEIDLSRTKGYDVRNMDMHDLTFKSKSFDCVYAAHSLEHSVSIWLALAEIWRVLKEDGLLWITLPTPKYSDKGGPKHQHLMIMDDWFMIPCLKSAGFEILYSINSEARYNFLCRKNPIEKVEPLKADVYRKLECLENEENVNE